MKENLNAELARILAENPDLPVKVEISCDLAVSENAWCIGKICCCEVTEYVAYGAMKCFYFGRDNDFLRDELRDEISDSRMDEIPDDELEQLVNERIGSLDWKPCIWLQVGP